MPPQNAGVFAGVSSLPNYSSRSLGDPLEFCDESSEVFESRVEMFAGIPLRFLRIEVSLKAIGDLYLRLPANSVSGFGRSTHWIPPSADHLVGPDGETSGPSFPVELTIFPALTDGNVAASLGNLAPTSNEGCGKCRDEGGADCSADDGLLG